jgi:putative membrane protein
MKFKALLLFSSMLAVAACGQRNDTGANAAMNDSSMTGTNMDAGNMAMNDNTAMSPTSAQGFANDAAASDRFEIESSKLASDAGASAATKAFAAKMISAHTASTAKLKSTTGGMSPAVTPDDTLTAEQQSTLDNLKTLKGADFDAAYKAAQVDGHTKALDMLKAYSASGDTPALKTFADGMIPTVTAHLNMAKGLK